MDKKLKTILYSLLSIFLTMFAVTLYQKGNPKICGYIFITIIFSIGTSYLLITLYQISKNIKNNNYLIQIALNIFAIELFIVYSIDIFLKTLKIFNKKILKLFLSQVKKPLKFIIIIVFIISLIIYFNEYTIFQKNIINTIIFFISIVTIFLCIVKILLYKKQVLILILTGIIVTIVCSLIGLLQSTDFSLAAVIFVFGMLFTIIENIEKFIELDTYYPKEIVTLENDDKIKRNKLVLNLIIGILFILTYITFKILNVQQLKKKILEYTKLTVLYEPLAMGLLVLIILEILTILFLYIFSKKLEIISNHSKLYSNENIIELIYSMLTFGIKEKVIPKVIDNIAIGNHDIDQVNPEVFIENIREIPKDIHIILSKVEDVPTIRKLLVIYPNKEVYSCKISVSKNIVKRLSDIKLEDAINK